MNPDKNLLSISLFILKKLRQVRILELDEIKEKIKKEYGTVGEILFIESLGFLFLLGLIEYRVNGDNIEYVGE
jgi:di/tricarboxylate transporter